MAFTKGLVRICEFKNSDLLHLPWFTIATIATDKLTFSDWLTIINKNVIKTTTCLTPKPLGFRWSFAMLYNKYVWETSLNIFIYQIMIVGHDVPMYIWTSKWIFYLSRLKNHKGQVTVNDRLSLSHKSKYLNLFPQNWNYISWNK